MMGLDSTGSTPQSSSDTARLPYIAGLDGLRAIAVVAVLLFHGGLSRSGGFLGVETFFVLSGYLITALLLMEWLRERRIDLPAFWLRRARRLLPALYCLLAATVLFAGVWLRGERTELGADVLAALAYVMNWRLILGGHPYFDPLLRPSLLQHLWSLAIEEQFYLLWPVLLAAGLRWLRPAVLLGLTVLLAVGSAVLMAVLYQPGADPSRLYYGTDTRAAGVLLGAALAMVWTPGYLPGSITRRLGRLLDGAGALALAGLLACYMVLSAQQPLLYRGGFALVGLLTVTVIVALTHPEAALVPRVLGWYPLRWIGLRSYGLYLWHWPVFQVTRPHIDLPLDGLPLFALRMAIVLMLVELSYRMVELPARRGGIERAWHAWRSRQRGQRLARWRTRLVAYTIPGLSILLLGLLLLPIGSAASRSSRASNSAASAPAAARALPATAASATQPAPAPAGQPIPSAAAAAPAPDETTPTPIAEAAATQLPASAPAATATPAEQQQLDPALAAQLQQLLDTTVADGYIPGAVLSVGIPGYVPWSGASGLADRQAGLAMAPDTLIHSASITKMFTAVVVVQLAGEGALDLDAPIGSYMPDNVPAERSITVRQLLSHTSGLYDYLEDPQFYVAAYQNPERAWTPAELVGLVDQFGVAFEPGTPGAWKYASTNYVVLGMLVEQVTGRPLAEQIRQRIIAPLGLDGTFFAPDEPLSGRLAQGAIGGSNRADVSMTFVFGTGNIVSTASDLRRFLDALFGGRLLPAASLEQMTTLIDTGGAYDMPELEYGLGLMGAQLSVGPRADGAARPAAASRVLGHIGGVAGTRAAAWWVPDSGISIALGLNQADVDPNVLARDALELILAWQGR